MVHSQPLSISAFYKLVLQVYLYLHSKNLVKVALNNLHQEELDSDEAREYGGDTTPSFSETEECSEITNMFLHDLNNFDQKIDEVIDTINLL